MLQNNAGDNLSIPSIGTYAFATPVKSGLTYAVTVLSQPSSPWQTCSVTAPAGMVGGAPVVLAVNCATNSYAVGGTVTGLAGTGLTLRDNGGDDRGINADGTFTFATPVASGAPYDVTVATQPSSPAQSCVVGNGTGTVGAGPVSGVTIACANVATCAAVDENQTLTLSCPTGRKIFVDRLRQLRYADRHVRRLRPRDLPRRQQRVDRRRGLRRQELVHGERHQRGVRRSVCGYIQAPVGASKLFVSS